MTRSFRETLVIQSSTHSLTWKYERIALLCGLRYNEAFYSILRRDRSRRVFRNNSSRIGDSW